LDIGFIAPLLIVRLICAVFGWSLVYLSSRIEQRRTERYIEKFGGHDRHVGQSPQKDAPMFKIVAVVFIGILTGIGFFDLGQEAYTLAALLLGIGALLDHGRKRARADLGPHSTTHAAFRLGRPIIQDRPEGLHPRRRTR
jgi:hypothetical protein